ncbi:hypothetical protein L2E82_26911 [Cichorium intybus]|uniref:Uncharacterized protein n=1 Tax=Cichorium intybus TaxID=13427 RepID=A0ACB9CRM8_CICIN|nr:hypothetical protein L2E82_26911 [Cichorium intybus]
MKILPLKRIAVISPFNTRGNFDVDLILRNKARMVSLLQLELDSNPLYLDWDYNLDHEHHRKEASLQQQ